MIKKTLILFISIFLLTPFTNAKVKIKVWWGNYSSPIMKTWIKSYIWNNNRSISDLSTSDINMCSKKDYTKDNFLCDSIESLSLSSKAIEVNNLQRELENTMVNQYNSVSVNAYNYKVNTYNTLIKEYNSELEKKCINMVEYCKPYECNIKSPWTIYQKSTDSCICENWQFFDKNIWIKTWNGCKVKEEITKQCQNTFWIYAYSNGTKWKNWNYDCFCEDGYTWNSNNTSCIKDYTKMTPTEICQEKYWTFSYWDNERCYCEDGYKLARDNKSCIKKSLLEKFKNILK